MNNLPVFFYSQPISGSEPISLPEDTARHVIQVLRMKQGDQILLTDGAGNVFTAEITSDHKKGAQVKVLSANLEKKANPVITIAISLVKNTNRFEWFLEKATEVGVQEIVPLICARTEKQHFKAARMESILISAMLQSRQAWLPRLHEPVLYDQFVRQCHQPKRYIAHCLETERHSLTGTDNQDAIILIGPEGDFAPEEITLAIAHQFVAVTLGTTRLRTETAGIVAAVMLKG